ncbi:hypothetical protein AB1Y20_015516 [Prymnesium parvum]|uniref:ADP,ATP carrier protein n=1 Tax=Prymnesium parvum TaxID=97485 RepID=A0AB34K374_PRYPA
MADGRDLLEGKATLNAMAGGVASGAVLAVLFPMDVIKTHVQTAEFDRRVLLPRLYRGFTPAIVEHSLNRYMLFGISTIIRDQMPQQWPEPARDASSGFGAALIKTICLHPLDTIKCRWQLGQPRYDLNGLYNGFSAAATRSAGGMAIWLAARNHLERVLPDENSSRSARVPSFLVSDNARHFLSGAIASMLTDLATFPFDTLKKNLQAAPSGKGASMVGFSSMTSQLLRNGGILRFYHGYSLRLTMVGLKGAMDNVVFVYCKRYLEPFI